MATPKHPSGLSKRQRQQIIKYMSDDRALIAAVATTVTKKRKSSRARKIARGDIPLISRIVSDQLQRIPPEQLAKLKQQVCENGNYCVNRKDYKMVAYVIQGATFFLSPHVCAVCVITFAIKFRIFDELCECRAKTAIRTQRNQHQDGADTPADDDGTDDQVGGT